MMLEFLMRYAEHFGKEFPLLKVRGKAESEIRAIILDAIARNVPYGEPETEEDDPETKETMQETKEAPPVEVPKPVGSKVTSRKAKAAVKAG